MSNLFDTNQDDQIQIDPNKNYFDELVGDGKKFKTNEDLAKKSLYADAHIKRLEQENAAKDAMYARLQAEYDAAANLREIADKLAQGRPLENHEEPKVNNEQTQPAMKPEEIQKLVADGIRQNDTEKQYQSNFREVQAKLKERFGNNYASVLQEQTENLGLSPELVNNLARTAPKAFFKTMGLDDEKADLFQTPPRSQQNFTPNTKNKRTWGWYEELRKSDPKTYNKPETQLQMQLDRNDLGEAFKDASWGSFQVRR